MADKPDRSATETAAVPGGIETHSSRSLQAAVRMALSEGEGTKTEQRKEFSAALVHESRGLSAYIVDKRLAASRT